MTKQAPQERKPRWWDCILFHPWGMWTMMDGRTRDILYGVPMEWRECIGQQRTCRRCGKTKIRAI